MRISFAQIQFIIRDGYLGSLIQLRELPIFNLAWKIFDKPLATSLCPSVTSQTAMAHMWKSAWAKATHHHHHHHHTFTTSHTHQHHNIFPPTDPLAPPPTPET